MKMPLFSPDNKILDYIYKDVFYIALMPGVRVISYSDESVYFYCVNNYSLAQIITLTEGSVSITQMIDVDNVATNILTYGSKASRESFIKNIERHLESKNFNLNSFQYN